MSLEQLKTRIKNRTWGGIYLLYGAEEYTKDFYLSAFRSAVTSVPEFNLLKFDGESLDPHALGNALDAPPYLSDLKVIEIDNFPADKNKDVQKAIVDAVAECSDDTAVIFFYRDGKFDGKLLEKSEASPLADFLAANAVVAECAAETGDRLAAWIVKHFKARSVSIEKDAVDFLPSYCGTDMYILSGEIEKLASVAGKEPLRITDVERICAPNLHYRVFDLTRYITERNAAKCAGILNSLAAEKTPPELIVGAASKNFTDLYTVRLALNEGRDAASIRSTLKMQDWLLRRTMSAARSASLPMLRFAIEACARCDESVKGFSSDNYLTVSLLVTRLIAYDA